ncbi:hypothetical protein [Saccharicrinis sp. FJH54]|uniref:hypothetical protein n=1 Tax=Saccharicrinis sp. FJH54 TaxID=3344665 RepID=UPI0035D4C436
MKLRIKSTKTTITILGIYQIVASLMGFSLVAYLLIRTNEINGPILFIFFISIGLYGLAYKSGILLLRKNYNRGLIYSMISQITQIIAVAFGGNKYAFSSGIKISSGFNFTKGFTLNFDFGFRSEFNISINTSDREYFLYINFAAIFLLYLFYNIYKELKSEKTKNNIGDLENENEVRTPNTRS